MINGHNKIILNEQEKFLHAIVGTKHNARQTEVANIKMLYIILKFQSQI